MATDHIDCDILGVVAKKKVMFLKADWLCKFSDTYFKLFPTGKLSIKNIRIAYASKPHLSWNLSTPAFPRLAIFQMLLGKQEKGHEDNSPPSVIEMGEIRRYLSLCVTDAFLTKDFR